MTCEPQCYLVLSAQYIELVHISVCNGKNFNNMLKISDTITPNIVDWVMCPGSVHNSFKVCSDSVLKYRDLTARDVYEILFNV